MMYMQSVISEEYRYDRTVVAVDAVLIAMYNRPVAMEIVVTGEPHPVSQRSKINVNNK